MLYHAITDLIGNTPLLEIDPQVHGLRHVRLYAKLEYANAFGSVKDRIAMGMLAPHLADLRATGKTVLEASSGNTGKALALLAAVNGLGFKAITNRIKVNEMRMLLQLCGAEIEELPGLSDCPDLSDPNSYTVAAANLAASHPDEYCYTDQYFNAANWRSHYATTGREITEDLPHTDLFIGALGTCGSSYGIGQYLRERDLATQVWGVIAGPGHHIPGVRNANELWEVGFFDRSFYQQVLEATTDDAIDGVLALLRGCGMLCGPTTGATYTAALRQLRELDATCTQPYHVVFIACDRVEGYLSYFKTHRPELFQPAATARPRVHALTAAAIAQAPEIGGADLVTQLGEPLIIDMRGNFPYSIGHLPTSINILDEFLTRMVEEGRVFAPERRIVLVCRLGDISRRFAAFLCAQGYDAVSLRGGVTDWKAAGQPLERSAHA
ncbi:MAG: pyridoxal-phosphate dependent enzyme [Ktedonobacterales bacterium]|nr:pyridoxal-phosphate dependent enzyme [Ktedonobacterales bacterium]